MKSITRLLLILPLSLFVTNQWAVAGGTSVRGGGDPCENRFKIARDDLKLWIHQGGPDGLELPIKLSVTQYSQAMLSQMETAQIKCVGPGDSDYPVAIEGIPKVCKFERAEHGGQITCDYRKFLLSSASDQYVLVHHEYAGLAGIEPPNRSDCHYEISNQILGFFSTQGGTNKLIVKPTAADGTIGVSTSAADDDEEERVISASVHEEIACASTSKSRVFCWKAPEVPELYWANPDLLNPPRDLKNPKEIVTDNSSACVTTDQGIRCWGRDAAEIEAKSASWNHPKSLRLFLQREPEQGWKYSHVLCAITDQDVKCTNSQEKELPPEATQPDQLLVISQYSLCALKNGSVYCSNPETSPNPLFSDASQIPAELGRLRDVSFTAGGLNGCGISTTKGLSCWGNPHFMNYLKPQPDLTDALKVIAETDETCVITSDHRMKCWGEPYRNTHLVPDSFELSDIFVSGTNKCVINSVGKMRCLSDNVPDLGFSLIVPQEIRF